MKKDKDHAGKHSTAFYFVMALIIAAAVAIKTLAPYAVVMLLIKGFIMLFT